MYAVIFQIIFVLDPEGVGSIGHVTLHLNTSVVISRGSV